MHFDKAYVIGFEQTGAKRLERFFQHANKAGVEVELFPAVNGREVDTLEFKTQGYLGEEFELRMPGSLGCLLSHVTLWDKIAADSHNEIILVCEDDALLNRKFRDQLAAIPWSEVPDDWDVIRLASHKVTGDTVSKHFVRPPTRYLRGRNSGTFCYLLKASSALKIKSVLLPYDNKQSMDVLLKKRSDQYNLYISKKPLARELRFRYSPRVDLNTSGKPHKGFKQFLIRISKRFLR